MKQTTNYNLKKIELTDSPPDITVHSGNFDIIDEELKRLDDDKVDKEEDKQLSDENYTKDEKDKLADIEEEANNYTHPTGAGNKHIPSGGAAGQVLKYAGTSGTAKWEDETVTEIEDSLISSSADKALSAKQGKALSDTIGPLANLLTTIKTSIVNAINSLKEDVDEHKAEEATQNTLGHIKLSDIDAQKIKGIEVDTTNLAHGKTLRYDEDEEKWVIDFKGAGLIYDEGTEYCDFEHNNYVVLNKLPDRIECVYNETTNGKIAYVRTDTMVDLTNTDIVYLEIDCQQIRNYISNLYLRVSTRSALTSAEAEILLNSIKDGFSRQIFGIDVSALKGTFYIGMQFTNLVSGGAESIITIYRIWGE